MLLSIAYILVLGLILGSLCRKLGLPPLIGMLFAGVILGPYGLDMLSDSLLSISAELRQIALVIILIRAGLAMDLVALKRVGLPAALMSFIPACFEIVGMIILAPWLLGVSIIEAALLGSVIAAVSPAVIVPKMLYMIDNKIGTRRSIPQLIMAGASVDDIFVIVLFSSFCSLVSGGEVTASSFGQIPISIILGVGVGITVGYLLSLFFQKVHMRDTVKLLLLLSISFFFVAAESALKGVVPFSGLLAVMTMSASILYFYEAVARRISPKFTKLWVGAEIMLFVLVGATIDLKFAVGAGLSAVILLLGVLIFRLAGVFVSLLTAKGLDMKAKLFCMIAYIPKATVQAAIGSIPLSLGLPCGKIILTVAVLSIIITAPLGSLLIEKGYRLVKE
ncbi:MAG: cation:proton antiporter [Rikenellaceae bacterium]